MGTPGVVWGVCVLSEQEVCLVLFGVLCVSGCLGVGWVGTLGDACCGAHRVPSRLDGLRESSHGSWWCLLRGWCWVRVGCVFLVALVVMVG